MGLLCLVVWLVVLDWMVGWLRGGGSFFFNLWGVFFHFNFNVFFFLTIGCLQVGLGRWMLLFEGVIKSLTC